MRTIVVQVEGYAQMGKPTLVEAINKTLERHKNRTLSKIVPLSEFKVLVVLEDWRYLSAPQWP